MRETFYALALREYTVGTSICQEVGPIFFDPDSSFY